MLIKRQRKTLENVVTEYGDPFHVFSNGKSLSPNWFEGKFLQPTTWQLIKPSTCTFSQMTYWMGYVTCLNNTRELYYESSHNGLEEFGRKFFPFRI